MLAAGAPTRDQGRQLFERRAGAWGDMIFPVVAILVLWFLLSRADVLPRLPTRMSPGLPEKLASIGAVLVALLLIVRGNVWAALVMFGVSLWLLGRASRLAPPAERPRRPRLSRVRSATIEMDWDHRTGRMTGRVLAGRFEGQALAALGREQCATLYQASRAADPDGARLLEAYFDRRFPGWRRAGDDHADARPRRPASSLMSEDEAYEVLGLRRGASRDEIVRSHRTVMKKWHPDQGGSADLAARANEAKEVLLRRHA